MLLPQLLAVTLALSPSLVSAAIFPSNTLVKLIDEKGFRKAMKENVSGFMVPEESGVDV